MTEYAPTEVTAAAVKEFFRRKGADLVGIASADRFPPDSSNRDPCVHFRRVRSVVVFARRVAFSSATPYPSVAGLQFGDYTLEAQLNELAYEASLWLEDNGAITMPMPAGRDVVAYEVLQRPPLEPKILLKGSFDLRFAAVMAGLGQIGANGLLINERLGSRLRLCAVLSAAALEADAPFEFGGRLPDFCEDCGLRCVRACPAKALNAPGHVDHYRCLSIRPDLVDAETVLNQLHRDLRGGPLVMAAKMLSYTNSPPHTCATCTTQCPMDQGRRLATNPFPREGWVDADFIQAGTFPVRNNGG
jgi:epoxyqueuosine reductase